MEGDSGSFDQTLVLFQSFIFPTSNLDLYQVREIKRLGLIRDDLRGTVVSLLPRYLR